MKKVLFVATVASHINSFHIPYLKLLKEKGYEIHVASYENEKIEYCDRFFNLNFARFPFKLQNLKVYKELKKIIQENKYEIIHCHTPVGGVLTRLAAKNARKNGTRVIYTAHGFHFYNGAPFLNWVIYYPIEKYLAKYTDCIITINKEDYYLAQKKFKSHVEYIPGVGVNGDKFDIEMTAEETDNLKKELQLKEKDFVITIIGELNKNKNQILAIETLKDLIPEYPNFKLLIVGRGSLEEKYKQIIKKYKLEENIKILGYREDIPQLLKITNLLLSLSYREGLPVNVMEAMISKTPVVVTNCRGSRDLITNNKNGYIISQNNILELKEAILKIYCNPLVITKDSSEQYKLENVLKLYEKVYLQIVKV